MKFNIDDKFYIFEEGTHHNSFEVRTYIVSDIWTKGNNVHRYKSCESRWFSEKECLTKEEVIEKLNNRIEKIRRERK